MKELENKKLPYPKSVFFIISNELCERFSYYGMRTILSIYLTDMLLYNESDAKVIYHVFTMLVYFFPIFGAMLADSLLGKFRTIFYVSIIYAIGNIVLALAATPPLNLPAAEFSMLGLLLVALGTGGIKPCVSAFGGDQFVLPQQEAMLATFFSLFYFSINSGSFLSTIITPILREESCFDQESCFSLAFGVPGVLMVISIIIFGIGRPLYKIREPAGNMVVKVSKAIGTALSLKRKSKETKEHWMDYAEPKVGPILVAEIKATLKVLWLYIPLPIFWALFDQQGTGWTFQARHMDGDIGFYTILPDQMQVVNPLLILIFLPLFQYGIYPLLDKFNLLRTPLKRLVVGGILAALAFAISASVSLAIEAENPVLPAEGNGQLRIFNTLPCDMSINAPKLSGSPFDIKSKEFAAFIDLDVKGKVRFEADITASCYNGGLTSKQQLMLIEEQAVGYYFKANKEQLSPFKVTVKKPSKGLPIISTLVYVTDATATPHKNIKVEYGEAVVVYGNYVESEELKPGEYEVKIDGKVIKTIEVRLGGIYVAEITQNDEKFDINLVTVTDHNGIHMLLLIPQYVVLTMAEIMFSVTGLEFSYSQAPKSMKSVMQAAWLLTTAFGNLIVVIIESAQIFEDESSNFFLYAGLMLVDMLIFALMAMKYKYVEKGGADSSIFDNTEDDFSATKKSDAEGAENKGFSSE